MAHSEDFSVPLVDRLISRVLDKKSNLSQQSSLINSTLEEEKKNLYEFLSRNPSEFLYRYGVHLKQEHLQYFYPFMEDSMVAHYVCETQKKLNEHTVRVAVKNRRFNMMELLRKNGSCFNESEMRAKEPLLYEQLIGDDSSDEEKPDLVGLLLYVHDKQQIKKLKYEQKREEDDVREESDSDEESEEEKPVGKHKELLRQEFHTTVHTDFLAGKDTNFDYSKVDFDEELDMLQIKDRDDEERYFDAEDEDDEDMMET